MCFAPQRFMEPAVTAVMIILLAACRCGDPSEAPARAWRLRGDAAAQRKGEDRRAGPGHGRPAGSRARHHRAAGRHRGAPLHQAAIASLSVVAHLLDLDSSYDESRIMYQALHDDVHLRVSRHWQCIHTGCAKVMATVFSDCSVGLIALPACAQERDQEVDALRNQLRDSDAGAAELRTRLAEAEAHAQVCCLTRRETSMCACIPAVPSHTSQLLTGLCAPDESISPLRLAPMEPPPRTRPATPRRTRRWRRSSGRWRCSANEASCTAAWTPRRPTWRQRNGLHQRLFAVANLPTLMTNMRMTASPFDYMSRRAGTCPMLFKRCMV